MTAFIREGIRGRRAIAAAAMLVIVGCTSPPTDFLGPLPTGASEFARGGFIALNTTDAWAVARIIVRTTDWVHTSKGFALEFSMAAEAEASYEAAVTGLFQVVDSRPVPFLVENKLGIILSGNREEPLPMDLLLVLAVEGLASPTRLVLMTNGQQPPQAPPLAVAQGMDPSIASFRAVGSTPTERHRVVAEPGPGPHGLTLSVPWGLTAPGFRYLDFEVWAGNVPLSVEIRSFIDGRQRTEVRRYAEPASGGGARSWEFGSSGRDEIVIDPEASLTGEIALAALALPWVGADYGLLPGPLEYRGGYER